MGCSKRRTTGQWRRQAAMILIFTGLSLGSAAGAPCSANAGFDPAVFLVAPREPAQGDIVRVTMDMPKGATGGTVTFLGKTYPGFVSSGLLNVYIGVDMDTHAGLHPIRYDFGGESGSREISIRARTYDTERLTVPEKYTELDDQTLARVNAEAERLNALWNEISGQRLWTESFLKPATGPNGSPFGLRRYFNGKPRRPHSGLDIKAPEGSEVYASNVGKVVLAEDLFFTGNTVVIDHGMGLFTLYAHLQRIDVKVGQSVERSQRLGLVGKTGRVTGPHLHWAVRLGRMRVDPSTLPGVLL